MSKQQKVELDKSKLYGFKIVAKAGSEQPTSSKIGDGKTVALTLMASKMGSELGLKS